jgi:hypothetical protein
MVKVLCYQPWHHLNVHPKQLKSDFLLVKTCAWINDASNVNTCSYNFIGKSQCGHYKLGKTQSITFQQHNS